MAATCTWAWPVPPLMQPLNKHLLSSAFWGPGTQWQKRNPGPHGVWVHRYTCTFRIVHPPTGMDAQAHPLTHTHGRQPDSTPLTIAQHFLVESEHGARPGGADHGQQHQRQQQAQPTRPRHGGPGPFPPGSVGWSGDKHQGTGPEWPQPGWLTPSQPGGRKPWAAIPALPVTPHPSTLGFASLLWEESPSQPASSATVVASGLDMVPRPREDMALPRTTQQIGSRCRTQVVPEEDGGTPRWGDWGQRPIPRREPRPSAPRPVLCRLMPGIQPGLVSEASREGSRMLPILLLSCARWRNVLSVGLSHGPQPLPTQPSSVDLGRRSHAGPGWGAAAQIDN